MTSSSSHPRRATRAPTSRTVRGFTLLEVLLAFAILAMLTGMVTTNFVQNIEKGTKALSKRELREAGDTLYRKILYEWDNYKDGYSQTLDEAYAKFAQLSDLAYDRWAQYRAELEKKEATVVGSDPEADENLFSDTDTTTTVAPTEGEESITGLKLTRVTLRIFRTDDPDGEPLMVLNTWVDPHKGQLGGN